MAFYNANTLYLKSMISDHLEKFKQNKFYK